MFRSLKRSLYFVIARYFRFWAALVLKRWSPTVIVVTGSAGKTTLLHLIQAQLGTRAVYSHHANSAFGVPLHILGLSGVTGSRWRWAKLLCSAPFAAMRQAPKVRYYIAEVDVDRPREGAFLAQLLKPSITLWVSALHTHAAQFDRLVSAGSFASVEEAIAHEYGELVAAAKDLVIVNADNPLMVAQTSRTSAQVQMVTIKDLKKYHASAAGSYFSFGGKEHTVPALLPKNNYYQLAMTEMLLAYLGKKPAPYSGFTMPPGRSNVFQGIRGSTLIDSTYNNANLDSLSDVVAMFNDYQAPAKWLVIGDILEQGQHEAREHARLAEMLNNAHFDRLLLIGPRVKRYTMPKLSAAVQKRTTVFLMPWDVLQYLQQNLPADPPATVLFKGVRFLEGVIEALLANPADAANLPRREPIWHKRRKQWGL